MKNVIILVSIVFLFSITSLTTAYSEEDVDLLFKKGLESYQNGKIDEAISYFEKVIEIDPNHVDALSNIGGLVSTIGKHDEASSYLDRALEIEPNHVRALINKGILLSFLNQTDDGIFYLDKAIENEPDNIDALRNRAIHFLSQKNYQDALTDFYKILEIEPDNPLIQKDLAMAKTGLGYLRIDAFVEFIIRDNQGKLVIYFKTPNVLVLNHPIGQNYLDSLDVTEEISVNGTNYEVRQHLFNNAYDVDTVISMTALSYKNDQSLRILIGPSWGFPVKIGDTIDTLYTFFIPIE